MTVHTDSPAGGERLPVSDRPHLGLSDMRVSVEHGLHIGVAKTPTHHMHRHSRQQQCCGVTVTHPVRRPGVRHLPGQLAAQPVHQVTDAQGQVFAEWRGSPSAIAIAPDGAVFYWPYPSTRLSQLFRIQ